MFTTNYKCECYSQNFCSCPQKSARNAIFLENITDVAEALAEVMVICGIHPAKAKSAVNLIIHTFMHYDEIRERVDTAPRKRLCKEDLMHKLARKCLMNLIESQLTYSIIKRAFKAFYHGTSEGGVRDKKLETQLIHSQECMWVHAADRTAQILACFNSLLPSAQKTYKMKIEYVYKRLYDRMRGREEQLLSDDCTCKSCVRRAVVNLPKITKSHHSLHEDSLGAVLGSDSTESGDGTGSMACVKPPPCLECNCPTLSSNFNIDINARFLSTDCSQGPYTCVWAKVSNDDQRVNLCKELAEDHQCPVDCNSEGMICESDTECDCSNAYEDDLQESSSNNDNDLTHIDLDDTSNLN